MADKQNHNDSPDELNQEDLTQEALNIEDVGIPLGDFDDEPIPLDEEIEEVEVITEADSEDGEINPVEVPGNISLTDSVPEDIYSEILEDQEQAPLPLSLEDAMPGDEDLAIADEFDHDALPLSELDETPAEDHIAKEYPSIEEPMGSARLDEISQQLMNLEREFQSKLKYDAHKEKIIDSLHQELQGYKDNLVRKLLMNTFKDIIKIIDDIKKMTQHFISNEIIEEEPEKILSFLEAVPYDLEDILVYQGVTPFTSTDSQFDPTRQRVMNKVPTSQQDKDKTVAEHLRPGYAHETHIIRPELVNVYVFSNDADLTDTRSSDE